MSLYDYNQSAEISMQDYAFYALIMAAIRQADTDNLEKLKKSFPEQYNELIFRYNAPLGILNGESIERDGIIYTNIDGKIIEEK